MFVDGHEGLDEGLFRNSLRVDAFARSAAAILWIDSPGTFSFQTLRRDDQLEAVEVIVEGRTR